MITTSRGLSTALAALALIVAFATPTLAGGKGDAHKNGNALSNSGQANGHANGNGPGNGGEASLAKGGNAAHASFQGLLHAAPGSQVGLLRAYADANAKALADQSVIDDFRAANPDYATLTDEEIAALQGGPEYLLALSETGADSAGADAAFASTGSDPAARGYVDGLLADYYAYLNSL